MIDSFPDGHPDSDDINSDCDIYVTVGRNNNGLVARKTFDKITFYSSRMPSSNSGPFDDNGGPSNPPPEYDSVTPKTSSGVNHDIGRMSGNATVAGDSFEPMFIDAPYDPSVKSQHTAEEKLKFLQMQQKKNYSVKVGEMTGNARVMEDAYAPIVMGQPSDPRADVKMRHDVESNRSQHAKQPWHDKKDKKKGP